MFLSYNHSLKAVSIVFQSKDKRNNTKLVSGMKHGISSGLTLTELLVTVSVIGLLFSMTLPVLAKAKVTARKISCLNHLRQWGIGLQLFTMDHDGLLPKDGSGSGSSTQSGWYVDLPQALGIPTYHSRPWRTNAAAEIEKTIWICPGNPRRSNGKNLFHYSANRHVNGSGAGRQVRLTSIPVPSETIYLFDNSKKAPVAGPNNLHTNLHSKGSQILFLDGGVRWLGYKEVVDPSSGKVRFAGKGFRWGP